MKRVLVLVLTCLLVMSAAASAATLRVGMECAFAPFNWTQPEQTDTTVPIVSGGFADGYDVRIAKLIADGLGMDLEIHMIAWEGLPMAVQSGDIDLIINDMSPTTERKMSMDFTDTYYENDLAIVVRKDGMFASATQLSDFSGAKLTSQLNTILYDAIDQIPGADKQPASESFPAMAVALGAGAIDGYVSERPSALSAVHANPDFAIVSFDEGKGFVIPSEDSQVAIALKKGSNLTEKVNKILAGISKEQRLEIMDAASKVEPLQTN